MCGADLAPHQELISFDEHEERRKEHLWFREGLRTWDGTEEEFRGDSFSSVVNIIECKQHDDRMMRWPIRNLDVHAYGISPPVGRQCVCFHDRHMHRTSSKLREGDRCTSLASFHERRSDNRASCTVAPFDRGATTILVQRNNRAWCACRG